MKNAIRKGAFDDLNKGSGALGKVKCKVVALSGAPPEELYEIAAKRLKINSVLTRCIVKGEALKSPPFWRFSGGF